MLVALMKLKSDGQRVNPPSVVSAGGAGVLASCTNTSVTDEAHLSQLALC